MRRRFAVIGAMAVSKKGTAATLLPGKEVKRWRLLPTRTQRHDVHVKPIFIEKQLCVRSLEGNEWKCKKGTGHNNVEQGYALGLAALFENCLYVCQLSSVSWPPSCHLEGNFPANFHSGLLCMRRTWTKTRGGQVHVEQILWGACLQASSWTGIQTMHIPICTVITKDLGAGYNPGYTSNCSSLSSTASHVLSHLYLQGQQGVAGHVISS